MTVGELWDISNANPFIFWYAFLRYKIIRIGVAPDIGTIYLQDLNRIEASALPPVVMKRLEPKISECEKEGIRLEAVFKPPHLTPDHFNTLFLKTDDARILCILQIFVLRRNPAFFRCTFKCVTFCTDGNVIETIDSRPEISGPEYWKLEHHSGATVAQVQKRHRERIEPLKSVAKELNLEQAHQEIVDFTNKILDLFRVRGVLVEMTEKEVQTMKWRVEEAERTQG